MSEDWWALTLSKQSSFFKSRAWVEDNGKIRKHWNIKELFVLFFKTQEVAIYLLISLIKTWETFINSFICLFLNMAFFPALSYTPHKATSHFVEVWFRFVQTAVFFLPFSILGFVINWSQTFINSYKFYFVLVHYVYVVSKNVELVPVLSSVFCYFFRFLKNRDRMEHHQ